MGCSASHNAYEVDDNYPAAVPHFLYYWDGRDVSHDRLEPPAFAPLLFCCGTEG